MAIFGFIDKKHHIDGQKCSKFFIALTAGIRGEKAREFT
jgi:hypothetical protein